MNSEVSENGVKDDEIALPGTSSYQPDPDVKNVFVCAECKIIFNSQYQCTKHMKNVHNLQNFNVSDIDLVAESKKTVIQRRKVQLPFRYSAEGGSVVPKKFQVTKDTDLYRCLQCPYSFENYEVYLCHESSHFEMATTIKFICRICQGQAEAVTRNGIVENLKEVYHFGTWSKCSWHLWKVHNVDCELNSCSKPGCDFKSVSAHKVREHESVHSPGRDFRCLTCHKTFKQLKQLRTHEKYHQVKNTKLPPPTESRWYTTQKCDICSRILSDSKCLKKHIAAVHNKLKPNTCNICGHQSARKAELQLHLRTHTREKPHKCPTCPFATGDHNSLRRHILTHSSNPKPYQCPLCSFSCIQSAGFKRHVIAMHSEDDTANTLFVCPYCPRISVSKSMYEHHIRDHDQGLIPTQDMQALESDKDSPPCERRSTTSFLNIDDSSSNSNTSGTNCSAPPPRPVSYWNRDDDSSIEMIVDTGGITIPAKPPTPPPPPPPALSSGMLSETITL